MEFSFQPLFIRLSANFSSRLGVPLLTMQSKLCTQSQDLKIISHDFLSSHSCFILISAPAHLVFFLDYSDKENISYTASQHKNYQTHHEIAFNNHCKQEISSGAKKFTTILYNRNALTVYSFPGYSYNK